MEVNDLSTVECLRQLLEQQARKLRNAAQYIESLGRAGAQVTQPARWSGLARTAHDDLAERLLSNLTAASNAAHRAADESAHAAATLATRVG